MGEIHPIMTKLKAQGVQPVGLIIGATRHFKALYAAASDPAGASQGIARLRPPIFRATARQDAQASARLGRCEA